MFLADYHAKIKEDCQPTLTAQMCVGKHMHEWDDISLLTCEYQWELFNLDSCNPIQPFISIKNVSSPFQKKNMTHSQKKSFAYWQIW